MLILGRLGRGEERPSRAREIYTAAQRRVVSAGSPELRTSAEAGAGVNAKDGAEMTLLMLAVATDHCDIKVVRALMAKGADVNAKSSG